MISDQEAQLRVVAIDGPAGSGKSTIAKLVASRLGLEYLDTGAMYRSVVFACSAEGIELENTKAVIAATQGLEIDFGLADELTVNGQDATLAIRTSAVSSLVSKIAAIPEVRAELVERQREWAIERGGGVLEGRDIGTVVFPKATLKVYLSANETVRAQRRAAESGTPDVAAVSADLAKRDHVDSTRKASPLTKAGDAVEIDTSYMSIAEVVDAVVSCVEEIEGLSSNQDGGAI